MSSTYTVKSGDTLTLIARRHGLDSWKDVYYFEENEPFRRKRPNPDKIYPGDVLQIPDGQSPPAETFRPCNRDELPAPPLGLPGFGPREEPPSPGFVLVSAPTGPMALAMRNVREARKWIGEAIDALNDVIGFDGKRKDIANLPQFKALQTHFHVTLEPSSILDRIIPFRDDPLVAVLKTIRTTYNDMSLTDKQVKKSFRNAPATGEGEDASAYVPRKRDGTIRFTPLYPKLGKLSRVHVLVHEFAHFVDQHIQDYAYRDRTGEKDKEKYRKLPPQFAVKNADSYAYFALQMGKNIDRVIKKKE